MPICKKIVEKHGGCIWAESPGKGKGTTFYFTLKQAN
ncbi:MAG: ATP-binding protein [Candidatus Thermoplasmatota archaeon]